MKDDVKQRLAQIRQLIDQCWSVAFECGGFVSRSGVTPHLCGHCGEERWIHDVASHLRWAVAEIEGRG